MYRLPRRAFLVSATAATTGCLLARGVSGGSAEPTFRAGAATSDITLFLGVNNGGVIARGGPAAHVHDPLHARCLALDDGRTKLALAVCDMRMIDRQIVQEAKQFIQSATGLSPEQVLISATHTHAAPGTPALHGSELDRTYRAFLARRIADAVRCAVNNLAPAKIGWGLGTRPQHVFNRRWRMKPGSVPANPFGVQGEQVQMNPPAGSPNLVEPAGPVDPQLSILSVQHADGRPLALLGNYSLHYVGGYERNDVSADYYGAFAQRVQELLAPERGAPPFVAMMSNGTSGDVNNIDFRQPREKQPPWSRMREVAYDLADEALRVWRSIEYHQRVELAVQTAELDLKVRRPDAARCEWAREVLKEEAEKQARLTRTRIYAEEALHLAEFPETVPVTLQAMRIGGLGIAAIPCEVFAETGLAIKQASALKPTFTIELANGYNGYLPTPQQHALGAYETWPSRGAYLEVQAEPQIRQKVLDLLAAVAK